MKSFTKFSRVVFVLAFFLSAFAFADGEAEGSEEAGPTGSPRPSANQRAATIVAGVAKLDAGLTPDAQKKLSTALTIAIAIPESGEGTPQEQIVRALRASGVVFGTEKDLQAFQASLQTEGVELDLNTLSTVNQGNSLERRQADNDRRQKSNDTRQTDNDARQVRNDQQQVNNNNQQRNNNDQQNNNDRQQQQNNNNQQQKQAVAQNQTPQAGAGANSGMGEQSEGQGGETPAAGAVQTVSTTPGTNIKVGDQPASEATIVSPGRYAVGVNATWTAPGQYNYQATVDGIFRPGNFQPGAPRKGAAPLLTSMTTKDLKGQAMLPPGYTLSSAASGSSNASRFIVDNHMAGVVGATGGSSYSQIYGADVRQDAISKSKVNGGRSPASVLETPTTAAGGHKPR